MRLEYQGVSVKSPLVPCADGDTEIKVEEDPLALRLEGRGRGGRRGGGFCDFPLVDAVAEIDGGELQGG